MASLQLWGLVLIYWGILTWLRYLWDIKSATLIKSNRNHLVCFSLLSHSPFSFFFPHFFCTVPYLLLSAPSWPVWVMLLQSASGQRCLLIPFTTLISFHLVKPLESYKPQGTLGYSAVLSLLLTPGSTLAQCGGPGVLWWPASPPATQVGAQLGIRAGGARTTFPALMWVSRVGVGTKGKRDYALLLMQAPRWR